jgi:hypothetical protein
MINRSHKRLKTGSHCSLECAMDHKVKIKDISIGGICLETSQHIDTRNPYDMKLINNVER